MVTFLDDQNTIFVVDIEKLRSTNKLKKTHFCFEIPNVKRYELTRTLIWEDKSGAIKFIDSADKDSTKWEIKTLLDDDEKRILNWSSNFQKFVFIRKEDDGPDTIHLYENCLD